MGTGAGSEAAEVLELVGPVMRKNDRFESVGYPAVDVEIQAVEGGKQPMDLVADMA